MAAYGVILVAAGVRVAPALRRWRESTRCSSCPRSSGPCSHRRATIIINDAAVVPTRQQFESILISLITTGLEVHTQLFILRNGSYGTGIASMVRW